MTLVRIPNQNGTTEEPEALAQLRPEVKDRVAEAYFGTLGPELRRATHKRLHWVCEQVQGQTVLDIGCSQAITAILLAREGLSVTAIDIDPRTITDAQNIITTEPQHVMRNISLVNDDFLTHDFGAQRFETVLLAEVLEHLVSPGRFVERAYNLTVPNGRAIVTVPFGINDWLDHKHTFYLLEPYRLVSRYFEVTECVLLDKWIGFIGARRASPIDQDKVLNLGFETVTLLEKGFFDVERVLRDQVAGLDESYRDVSKQYSSMREQAQNYKAQAADAQAALKRVEQASLSLKGEIAALEERLKTRIAENENGRELLFEKTSAYKDALHEAEKQQIRMEAELAALRAKLGESAGKYQLALQKLKQLSLRLGKQAEISEDGAKALAEQKKRIVQLEEAIKLAREKHEAQLSDLARQDELRDGELEAARKKTALGEAELAKLAGRLVESQAETERKLEDLAALGEEKARVEALLEEQAAQYKDALQKYKNKESEKETSLKSAWQKLTMLEGQVAGFKAKLTEAQGSLEALGAERDGLVARLKGVEEEKARAAREAEALLARLKAAEAGLIEQKSKAEAAQANSAEAQKSVAEKTALLATQNETIVKTRARVDELAVQVDRAVAEKAEFAKQFATLEGTLAAKTAESGNLATRLTKTEQTLAGVQETNRTLNLALTNLQEANRELDQQASERDALVEEVAALTDELGQLRLTLEDERALHGGEMETLRGELEASRLKIEEARRAFTALEGEYLQKTRAMNLAETALAQKEEQRQDALARLAGQQEAFNRLEDVHAAESGNLRTLLARAQGELAAQRDETSRLLAEAQARLEKTLEAERAEGLVRLEAARADLLLAIAMEKEEHDLILADASDEISTLQRALADEEQKSAQTAAALESVKRELAAGSARLAEVRAEKEQLSAKFEGAQRARAERDRELAATIDGQYEALKDSEAKLARLAGNLELLKAAHDQEGAAHREKISDLTARLALAEENYRAKEEKGAEDEARLAGLDAEIARLRGELAAREAEISVRDAEIERLGDNIQLLGRSQMEEAALSGARIVAIEQELNDLRLSRQNILYESGRSAERTALMEARLTGEIEALTLKLANLAAEKAEREEAHAEALAQAKLDLEEAFSRSEMQSAKLRDQENLLEKLKLQSMRSKKQINDCTRQISQLNQGLLAAEHKVAKTKDTLSYQLGNKLIQGFKSFDKFLSLPGELLKLRGEARKRRGKKGSVQARMAMPQFNPRGSVVAPPPVSPITGDLPRLGLGDAADLKSLKVACIMDEFTYTSYGPECNFLQLSPAHWRSEIEAVKPDLLFIESAWRGKDSLWGAKVAHRSREIIEIVQWCNRQGIPTAFWNKEDPVHFETFLTTAKLFDHVFTTDIDCIGRYKAALDHDRVYLLPFAAQPNLCNPVETYERKDAFNFAGAYYVRYPERTADLCSFLDILPEFKPLEIYDRNYEKNDPNYQFPEEYRPFIIGTLPFDKIDKAYKGYQYAINLNSIKNSQSMFARRVYELLASNTITVSNYSRGIRLMFGDLVVTSDSGQEVLDRLRKLDQNPVGKRKFRLLALRKAMQEHTYEDRVAYLVSKIQGLDLKLPTPRVIVLSYIKSQEHFDLLLGHFNRQNHPNKHFYGVTAPGIEITGGQGDERITIEDSLNLRGTSLGDLFDGSDWLAGMVPNDYYGENHLTDLTLATRYSDAQAFTRFAHYVCSEDGAMSIAYEGKQYRQVPSASARASIIRASLLEKTPVNDWVTGLYTHELSMAETGEKALSIDEFNYCKNGCGIAFYDNGLSLVSDATGIDVGVPLSELIARAEATPAETRVEDEAPVWGGDELHSVFAKAKAVDGIKLSVAGNSMLIESELPDGKHTYYTSPVDFVPERLGFDRELKFFLDITPGLNVMFLVFFFDAQGKRIGEAIKPANRNVTIEIPEDLKTMRFGLRIFSGGFARLNALVLGHRTQQSPTIISTSDTLVLTNFYPSYNALYRNAFVHSRVKGYAERGVDANVFCLRPGEALTFAEYSDVDIMTGGQEDLHRLLLAGNYKTVLVHFLDDFMWDVLKLHIDRIKVNVWVHGAEVQPYHRREYNFRTDAEREAAKIVSDKRIAFWRDILTPMHRNMKLIFVSQYFADEVMEDLGIKFEPDRYTIIHNPIDTDLFSYEGKNAEQRKNILSIRPYAFPKYANDLSVKAILELSTKPWFRDLKFRLVGDGVLFDQILEPLHNFENVHIERRFLPQSEIAELHKEYGVFLTPTRMDAQGVSRDEAMSSGLVPITNNVAAIPEFVDENCGILVPAEDYHGIAEGIERLYRDPAYFARLSQNAAQRVRSQSSAHKLIAEEMALFTDQGITIL